MRKPRRRRRKAVGRYSKQSEASASSCRPLAVGTRNEPRKLLLAPGDEPRKLLLAPRTSMHVC